MGTVRGDFQGDLSGRAPPGAGPLSMACFMDRSKASRSWAWRWRLIQTYFFKSFLLG